MGFEKLPDNELSEGVDFSLKQLSKLWNSPSQSSESLKCNTKLLNTNSKGIIRSD